MRRRGPRLLGFLLIAMLAMPAERPQAAAAQATGINWMSDLEAAKTLAKQTNRLVLVHFWTPSCGPCLALDQTVFNQAGVAAAIDQRFVAVKLNANENSATATGFGITRVPTDVVLTPDGHVVGKLISPPTPAGYLAEMNQIASAYMSTPGQGFANAASNAPSPSQINAAYANLPVGSNVLPAADAFAKTQAATAPAAGSPSSDPFQTAGVVNNSFAAPANPATQPGGAAMAPMGAPQGTAMPVTQSNLAATPAGGFAPPPVAPAPSQIENRYAMPPAAQQPPSAQAQAPALISGSSSAALSMRPDAAPSQPAQQPSSIAAQTPAGPGSTDGRQLPPGAPPLGFDGFCPVSMRNHWKWVAGDPHWGIVHRGRTYWFASQAEQQQFWADPDRYSPALSGMDPVLAIDHQQQVPGKREHSIDYDGLFYLFSSEATLAQFTANPERYAASVRQAMGIPRGRLVR